LNEVDLLHLKLDVAFLLLWQIADELDPSSYADIIAMLSKYNQEIVRDYEVRFATQLTSHKHTTHSDQLTSHKDTTHNSF
jgi:hypothetical protein